MPKLAVPFLDRLPFLTCPVAQTAEFPRLLQPGGGHQMGESCLLVKNNGSLPGTPHLPSPSLSHKNGRLGKTGSFPP